MRPRMRTSLWRAQSDQLADLLVGAMGRWDGWAHAGPWGPAGPLDAGGGLRLVRSAGLGLVLVERGAGSGSSRAAGGDLPGGGRDGAPSSGDDVGGVGSVSEAPSTALHRDDQGAAASHGEGGAASHELLALPGKVIALIRREAHMFDAVGSPIARPPVEIRNRLLFFHRCDVSLDQINEVLRDGRHVRA